MLRSYSVVFAAAYLRHQGHAALMTCMPGSGKRTSGMQGNESAVYSGEDKVDLAHVIQIFPDALEAFLHHERIAWAKGSGDAVAVR